MGLNYQSDEPIQRGLMPLMNSEASTNYPPLSLYFSPLLAQKKLVAMNCTATRK